MIHILTVHFRSPDWIDRQLRSIQEFAPTATTWASLDLIDESHFSKFDNSFSLENEDLGPGIEPYASTSVDPSGDRHGLKLNELARRAMNVASDSDQLLFLDGDALLLSSLEDVVASNSEMTAVRRDENDGDRFPHPSFCLVSVADWRTLGGDWRRGEFVHSATERLMTDTGTRLLSQLAEKEMPWVPLQRLNSKNLHPVWFGIYGTPELGPVVYHHGAGFRTRVSRADLAMSGKKKSMFRRSFEQRQLQLDVKVQRAIDRRPTQWQQMFL